MKKPVMALLVCILTLTFCLTGTVYAQEDEGLPEPGITPDSPFYFADRWMEQLVLRFTFREEAKAQKALQYAEEKLAEVDAMLSRNEVRATIQATNEYGNYLAIATRATGQAGQKGTHTAEMVAWATSKHLGILGDMADNVPQNAEEAMTQTRERARNCQETALRAMAQADPEGAIQINLRLMEQQLNRVRVRAEERETTKVQEGLREFERLSNLGGEISQIATSLGQGTTVDRLVGQATANHLAVLAEVHERVQEQAQQTTEDAIQACVENHERVVTSLKEKNMLGQIPEEHPLPDEISEKIRQRTSTGGSAKGP